MSPKSDITQLTLPNGLRLVHLRVPGSPAAYAGLAVRAGSRDERADEFGLAHFVEHTIFKGTATHSAMHIVSRLDGVGGELNAFTTKEDTVLYASFPRGYNARAIGLLADLAVNSQFPAAEINKERAVVEDEILSYMDIPAEAVYDNFEDLIFAGTGLGHNILGNVDSLAGFDSATCRRWLQRYYTAANSVFFYAGATGVDTIARLAEKYFADMPAGDGTSPQTRQIADNPQFTTIQNAPAHQAHTVMGAVAMPPEGNAAVHTSLAVNILGGPGMNSMLNLELRERRGLVYTVDASLTRFDDASLLAIYYGCDADDNRRCADLVRRSVCALASKPLGARQLALAKRQFIGQNTMASVNIENRIIAIARAICMGRKLYTAKQLADVIDAATPSDICNAIAAFAQLSSLSLMPNEL